MILVTGGTGLVGSHLLYHLTQESEEIRAVYRSKESLLNVRKVFSYYTSEVDLCFSKIDWQKADITDIPSMIPVFENVTHVYHCAAFISFDSADYREMRKVNIHGTAIMVNLAIDVKVQKFCYVSSIAAVGDDPKKPIADEQNEWAGNEKNHGYAITKYGGEMEVWRASQEGVDVVIVNPGVILGSGFWSSGSGKLFSNIHNGFQYYTYGTTGFVGVQDVVQAMVELMESEVKNERFILVAENKSFADVLFKIANEFGKKRPSKLVKPWASELFWRVEWLISKLMFRRPRMNKHTAKSLHSKTSYSSEKIQKAIGFQFEKIDAVIEKVCEDFS